MGKIFSKFLKNSKIWEFLNSTTNLNRLKKDRQNLKIHEKNTRKFKIFFRISQKFENLRTFEKFENCTRHSKRLKMFRKKLRSEGEKHQEIRNYLRSTGKIFFEFSQKFSQIFSFLNFMRISKKLKIGRPNLKVVGKIIRKSKILTTPTENILYNSKENFRKFWVVIEKNTKKFKKKYYRKKFFISKLLEMGSC